MTAYYKFIVMMIVFGIAINATNATAQEIPRLTLNRDYVGNDCVWGPVTMNDDVLAWAVEKSWKKHKPSWGEFLPATYSGKAIYRKNKGIELKFRDLPEGPLPVLSLGARSTNVKGRLSLGQDMIGDCRVNSRKGYPIVSEQLAKRLFGTSQPAERQAINLEIKIVDR
jgi:hypothetical protein